MNKLTIIGLGWAWYTAWIYAWRYGLVPTLIGENDWWLITENHLVENFPWYPEPKSGFEIMQDLKKQAERFGATIMLDKVKSITPIDPNDFTKWYNIETTFHWTIQSKAIILAIWTQKIKLWVPGEKEFFWKWVSYCATCDWFFYRWKKVAVVWGWDTALIEALYLSEIAEKVYLIHRRNQFRWEPIRLERLKQKTNVEIITPAIVEEILWSEKVEYIKIKKCINWQTIMDCQNFEEKLLPVDGVFIAIWTKPNPMPWLDEYLERDENWYIKVDECMKTNLPWIFAAWDVTTGSCYFKQLITACSEWAIAAESAFKYVEKTN